jgi:hypothetical protein
MKRCFGPALVAIAAASVALLRFLLLPMPELPWLLLLLLLLLLKIDLLRWRLLLLLLLWWGVGR